VRLNPWVYGLSLVVGILGFVFAGRAFMAYHDAAETFTEVELQYVPDSFAWRDGQFENGSATFRVVNDSDYRATVEHFGISLRFDGMFAGSDYRRWEPVSVPAGETREIPVTFTVTANSIQAEGGTAALGFVGQLRLTFASIEEPLVFRFRGDIGTAPYEDG
jgi:hypothetical protein